MAKQLLCATCLTVGSPKTVARGSFWIEVVLWLCFLVPGLLYSIWRLTTKHKACAACGGTQLVPLDSPMAGRLQAK